MCIISPSSVLVKKDILIKNGMFNERLKVCEDYELWLKITSKIPVSLVDEPCVIKYGGHPDQLSKKFWGIDRFRIKALEKLLLYYKLNHSQKKDMLEALLNKIKIIIIGAKKEKYKNDKNIFIQRKILVKSTQNDDMKKKNLRFVIALHVEAEPLLNLYKLKKYLNKKKASLFTII